MEREDTLFTGRASEQDYFA